MYDEFLKITGFDLEDYFNRFVDFINNKSQLIIDYYSGLLDNMDRDAFGEYKSLLSEISNIIGLFDLNMERFQTVDFWQLMEFADDAKIKLETIGVFSKYARTSVKKESFSNEVSVEVATRKGETIEELMTRVGSTNRDNEWADTAISNSLIQEDYTTEGGAIINITFKNNSRFFVDSVVDNPAGDKIKGKDIDKYMQFEDNDLKILGFDNTMLQSTGILTDLKKNDNPEFPAIGVDPSLIIGTTFKSASIPSIVRQIFQTFSTDDVVKQIQVLDSSFDQDSLSLKLNIVIKSGEEQKITLNV